MIRFTQTDKWEDKWFRKLTVGQKLIFLYLCDKCNMGGFVEWDGEFASFQIGVDADKIEGALKGLARGIVLKGDWIWIKNFYKHQKNSPINPNNPAHKNIIRCINDRKEFHNEIEQIYGALKPLFRGIGIGKGNSISKSNKKREYSKETKEDAEKLYTIYPRHENKIPSIEAICKAMDKTTFDILFEKVTTYFECMKNKEKKFIPFASTWFNQERWNDDSESWSSSDNLTYESLNGLEMVQ